jgi:FkbM family methyltransferase
MPINIAFIREVGPLRWAWRTAIRQYYKRVVKHDHTMRLPTGEWMTLPIGDHFASEAFITQGDVDWGSEKIMFSLLRQNGVFLDVGAHIGYYSLYMMPGVLKAYCFEPDPRVFALLEKNVGDNPKVETIPWAVGATAGRARFTLERDSEISHLSHYGEDKFRQIVVNVVTIDSFVFERGLAVEAIKIDIEGHDIEAIRGAMGLLEQQQPLVLTEARPDPELFALMQRISYRVHAFVRHPRTRKKAMVELSADVPVEGETKMLFLVPHRLKRHFAQAVKSVVSVR